VADLHFEALPDGCIRVSLSNGTRTVSTTVSSHHLIEDKRRQLEALLNTRNTDA
jgi:hypothetical protein